MSERRTFTPEFKAQVVLEVISGTKTAAEACRQHSIKPSLLSQWKTEFTENAFRVFQNRQPDSTEQARIAELERMVGRLALELEVAKKASSVLQTLQNRKGPRL